jgi:hypothetical protein
MATKIQIIGNSLVITDSVTSDVLFDKPKEDYYYDNSKLVDESIISIISRDLTKGSSLPDAILLSNAIDSFDVTFSEESFITFARLNLGFKTASGGSDAELIFVQDKNYFPTPVNGVITLRDNVTYYITDNIDLEGDRLISGNNTVILGASSENCSLTSTGIGTSFPTNYLIESLYTIPIRHITIKDVPLGIGINLDETGVQPIALDWTGVNFSGCGENMRCGTIGNFIFSKGAVLGGGKLIFQGSVGTIGIDNSLFVGNGSAESLFDLSSGLVVTRRFRIIYSSFVVFGSTVGINVDVNVTIPVDSYILDSVNFSAGGTYLQGLGTLYTENEPSWTNCKGIRNTVALANYYMNNNATDTVISAISTPVKIAGTTTPNVINQKFTHSNNKLIYTGELIKDFQVSVTISMSAGNNQELGLYVALDGVVIDSSEMYSTTSGVGKVESVTVQTILKLVNANYIEVWAENATQTTNITVEHINVIVKEL